MRGRICVWFVMTMSLSCASQEIIKNKYQAIYTPILCQQTISTLGCL